MIGIVINLMFQVSFVGPDGQISHTRMEHEGVPNQQFKVDGNGTPLFFDSLLQVIEYYKDILLFPFNSKTSSYWHTQACQYILSWKEERTKQMKTITNIISDLFDIMKEWPSSNENLKKTDSKEVEYRVNQIVENLFTITK